MRLPSIRFHMAAAGNMILELADAAAHPALGLFGAQLVGQIDDERLVHGVEA